MAKNLVQDGKVLHYAVKPTDSIKSGDLVAVEDVVGVAITDGKAGELLAVSVEGVYDIPVPAASGTIIRGKRCISTRLPKRFRSIRQTVRRLDMHGKPDSPAEQFRLKYSSDVHPVR